jgi:hypothetical protein
MFLLEAADVTSKVGKNYFIVFCILLKKTVELMTYKNSKNKYVHMKLSSYGLVKNRQ